MVYRDRLSRIRQAAELNTSITEAEVLNLPFEKQLLDGPRNVPNGNFRIDTVLVLQIDVIGLKLRSQFFYIFPRQSQQSLT